MNYTKTNRLNTRILSRLDSLNSGDYVPFYVKECSAGYHAFHYLTEHNRLVSFMGIMPVNENSVELTAYTFPSYRHQGHFTFNCYFNPQQCPVSINPSFLKMFTPL